VPQFISGSRYIISNYSPPVPHNITASLKMLPIIEVPAKTKNTDMPLMIIYSGDGGWRGFIDKIAVEFSDHGIPVIGVDVLKYFWNESSPEKSAKDLTAILEYYMHNWHRNKVILAGYSFGADVIPFIYDKLPGDIQARVSLLDLMSPSGYADFTFHFTSWLDENSSQNYKVATLLNTLEGPGIVMIFGKEENENFCEIKNKKTKIILVDGDHHYNYNQEEVVLPVMETINETKSLNE
jgi:type IV secretory pathway VirJ component